MSFSRNVYAGNGYAIQSEGKTSGKTFDHETIYDSRPAKGLGAVYLKGSGGKVSLKNSIIRTSTAYGVRADSGSTLTISYSTVYGATSGRPLGLRLVELDQPHVRPEVPVHDPDLGRLPDDRTELAGLRRRLGEGPARRSRPSSAPADHRAPTPYNHAPTRGGMRRPIGGPRRPAGARTEDRSWMASDRRPRPRRAPRILVVTNLYPTPGAPGLRDLRRRPRRGHAPRRGDGRGRGHHRPEPAPECRPQVPPAGADRAPEPRCPPACGGRPFDVVETHIAFPTGLVAWPIATLGGARLSLFCHGSDVIVLPWRSRAAGRPGPAPLRARRPRLRQQPLHRGRRRARGLARCAARSSS